MEKQTRAENTVRLVGRLSDDPEVRDLPSGDRVAVARLVVARDVVRTRADGRRGQSVDVVECAAWSARTRRSVSAWVAGDTVAVEGALRRRFFRAGGRTASRVEIEVRSCRRIGRRSGG